MNNFQDDFKKEDEKILKIILTIIIKNTIIESQQKRGKYEVVNSKPLWSKGNF